MPNPVDLTTPPVALQGGPGAAPGYGAMELRRLASTPFGQEGVLEALHLKVVQRAGGAGLGVDVNIGAAAVLGDSVARQGLYACDEPQAFTGARQLDIAAGGGQPRIDQVVLEVKDTAHDGSGLNTGRVRVVQGTETAGATLANRLGAAALPSTAVRLADVLMPIGSVQATTANIQDRRPWSRGFFARAVPTSIGFAAGSGLITIAEFSIAGEIGSSDGVQSNPVEVDYSATFQSVNGTVPDIGVYIDGATGANGIDLRAVNVPAGNSAAAVAGGDAYAVAAGRHTFEVKVQGNNANAFNVIQLRRSMRVREQVRAW